MHMHVYNYSQNYINYSFLICVKKHQIGFIIITTVWNKAYFPAHFKCSEVVAALYGMFVRSPQSFRTSHLCRDI